MTNINLRDTLSKYNIRISKLREQHTTLWNEEIEIDRQKDIILYDIIKYEELLKNSIWAYDADRQELTSYIDTHDYTKLIELLGIQYNDNRFFMSKNLKISLNDNIIIIETIECKKEQQIIQLQKFINDFGLVISTENLDEKIEIHKKAIEDINKIKEEIKELVPRLPQNLHNG
jgi:hypothetical protein